MLKDFLASKMFTMLRNGCAVAEIARRLPMSEKTIRTYRDKDLLPSQVERAPRTHRTRRVWHWRLRSLRVPLAVPVRTKEVIIIISSRPNEMNST